MDTSSLEAMMQQGRPSVPQQQRSGPPKLAPMGPAMNGHSNGHAPARPGVLDSQLFSTQGGFGGRLARVGDWPALAASVLLASLSGCIRIAGLLPAVRFARRLAGGPAAREQGWLHHSHAAPGWSGWDLDAFCWAALQVLTTCRPARRQRGQPGHAGPGGAAAAVQGRAARAGLAV